MIKQEEIREGLAELEHLQWIEWARNIMVKENLSPERIGRWNKLMIPYSQLAEEQKDRDRIWADKSLETLHSQGVVIKADQELPSRFLLITRSPQNAYEQAERDMVGAGYVAVEPLIEVEDDQASDKG